LLAYTNIDSEEVVQTEWRRSNTRNASAKKVVSDTTNNSDLTQLSPGKFIDTTQKRLDIKDPVKSVKTQNRVKGLNTSI